MKYTKAWKHVISLRYLYFALGLCGILIAAIGNSPAPTRAALKPPDPAYNGVHDRADCFQIRGWARDENRPDEPINVDIYDGSTLLATRPANLSLRHLVGTEMDNHGFLLATPDSLKDGKIHSIFVKFGGTFIDLSDSPRFIACEASLFPTAVPQSTASGQGQTWEQGVEFSSSMSGTITKIRFWRAAEEPQGNHIGHIWSASGTKLKTVTFNETSTPGWQEATVSFPITAGVKYKVTYNINYVVAKTLNVFNNGPITRGPLTAWRSTYSTPAGSNPTTFSTSNLFADIVFNAPRP